MKEKSRAFIKEIRILSEKYDLPFFAITDGASAYSNNGNTAIKHARESHKEWEKSNNHDPYEDWSITE